MADVRAVDESADSRKLDVAKAKKVLQEDHVAADSSKRQRTDVADEKNGSVAPPAAEKVAESGEQMNVSAAVEEAREEDDEDYNAEQDEDADGDANGEGENVDRKGKGILVEDRKGKGKMIEEYVEDYDSDEDDDDDDSSDDSDSDFSDGLDDSDLEDDPLAEVDLDNILPSRTRKNQVQPGFRIFSDQDKGKNV